MVQGYYTLQEAAQVLGMAPDELKQMAQKNQIRSFQDRGTWRFRVQDIQEMARQRGAASDPELILGDASAPVSPRPPKSSGPKSPQPKSPQSRSGQPKSSLPRSGQPKSGPKTPAGPRTPSKSTVPDVFDFDLDLGEDIGIGQEPAPPKADSKKPLATPRPPGSDSDVRLVADSNSDMEFVFDAPSKGASDSDVKLVGEDIPRPATPKPATPKPAPQPVQRKSALGPESPVPKKKSRLATPDRVDSGVRLVPMDSDSDVKIVGSSSSDAPIGELPPPAATDSDIRLEAPPSNRPAPRGDEGLLTEEIDLDAELRKQQEALAKQKPQAKVKQKSKLPKFPSVSPFELSESQLKLPPSESGLSSPAKPDSSDFDLTPAAQKPDSSDFDLTPPKPDSSDFDLSPKADSSDFDLSPAESGEDFSLELPDESDIKLTPGSSGELKGPSSGISLGNPADAGISLEQGGEGSDEIEFELSLDVEATPKPAAAAAPQSADSSEFELSLDSDEAPSASDSEFELTLDDSGGLAPLEEGAPQVKAGEDKDIFETDFEVPALEEESGSQVAPLETDLDSSDFDLALGDSEIVSEEESGSQVVALDEEEADDASATVAANQDLAVDEDQELGFDQLEEAPELEEAAAETGPVREVVRERLIKSAPWGVMPVLVMLPCVIVMFLIGVMGFELIQNMNSYKPTTFMTKTIGDLVGQKPK